MNFYWKLNKCNYFFTAIELKKRIKELDKIDAYYIADCLKGSNLEFYQETKEKVPFGVRLTIIPAILVIILLWIFLPINFIITGRWSYEFKWMENWFRMLKL